MKIALRSNETLSALIVDDDPEIRFLIKEALKDMKCFTFLVEATDGRDALQKSTVQSFDIIVTDLAMPKLEGISFINMCKSSRNLKDCSFLVISGGVTQEKLNQALELGVSGIITKPFTIEALQEKVVSLLTNTKAKKLIIS